MRNYTPEKYKELVTEIDDEIFQKYMSDEQHFITGVEDAKGRTFVDLGAGSGRVEPYLAEVARDIVAIEINPAMYQQLEQTAKDLPNVTAVQGDFLKLLEILPADLEHPMFLILLNSLGTVEGGNYQDVMDVVTKEATRQKGQLVLSLLRQRVLGNWGLSFYKKIGPMAGNVDMEKSDFDEGVLVTDTGYTSKWWTDEDIRGFKQKGRVVREESTNEYTFLQLEF